jgi:pimeloyl-ACP methyl ester carboxylesterase
VNRVVRGIPVHYVEVGEGRPVLMFHGIPADHRHMVASFEPIFERRSGWRRIYPDLPGHGLTPRADWIRTDDDKLQIALGLLESLAPGERFVVIGASYGGYMALGALYHRAADIDGAALLVTNPLPETRSVGKHQVFVRDDAAVASLTEDEQGWLRMSTIQTVENLAFYRANIHPALRIADHAFLDTVEPFPFAVDTLPEPFPRPALVINARQDGATGYADILSLVESFSRGTFAILDRAGHPLVGEQPVLFAALVNEWLDRVELEPPI